MYQEKLNMLLEKYDVEADVAQRDAQALADAWLQAGVVTL